MLTQTVLNSIGSRRSLYRLAKRIQPAYFRWLSFEARAIRSLTASYGMSRVLQNPSGAIAAVTLFESREAEAAGLRADVIHPETNARRTLPDGLPSAARLTFSRVQCAASGIAVVYTLQDGRAWGSGGAVLSRDRRLVGDLSPVVRLPPESHPVFRRPIFGEPKRLDGCLALMTGPSPDNVSHWFFGILPRISLLKQWDPTLNRIDSILTPALRAPFQIECLRRFDVPSAKVIEARSTTFLEAAEIAAPSFVSPAYVAPRWFLEDLRRRFEDVPPAPHAARIYVSRRDAPGRRVRNEGEVTTLLASLGFQTVQLERLPFLDQVALFKGAEVVVAPHGAGLTYLAFARAGAAVVELFSPFYINPMYWCVADEVGVRYRHCIGMTSESGDRRDLVRDDITIDVKELASTVTSLIAS